VDACRGTQIRGDWRKHVSNAVRVHDTVRGYRLPVAHRQRQELQTRQGKHALGNVVRTVLTCYAIKTGARASQSAQFASQVRLEERCNQRTSARRASLGNPYTKVRPDSFFVCAEQPETRGLSSSAHYSACFSQSRLYRLGSYSGLQRMRRLPVKSKRSQLGLLEDTRLA